MVHWFPLIGVGLVLFGVSLVRDLVLFRTRPVDWVPTLLTVAAFAIGGLSAGFIFSNRQLRRLG